MDSFVLARRENTGGAYFGFREDFEVLQCSACGGRAEYRLRYTENEERNLDELRRMARHTIAAEHPKHSDEFRVR